MREKKTLLFYKEEQGSALVFMALALAGLLAITGLVLDGGTVYVIKSRLQKEANASVLSGAQELTGTESSVQDVVNTVLQAHGDRDSLTKTDIVMGKKVSVQLQKEVPLGFAKLFHTPTAAVRAKASAELGTMGAGIGAAPLGIDENISLEYLKEYKLKVDQTDVSYGNFGVMALGGPGASTYEDNLLHGYKNELRVGQTVDTQTGNIAGKTRTAVQSRIDQCPYMPGDVSHRDCPRILLILVYKPADYSEGQLKHVEITGFAYFYITEPMSSQDTSITGMFIQRAGTGTVNSSAINRGAFAIRLTE